MTGDNFITWDKHEYGNDLPTYYLTKEANPLYFAKVFAKDGRYIYTIGKRGASGQYTTERITYNKTGWSNASIAKLRAIEAIIKIFN